VEVDIFGCVGRLVRELIKRSGARSEGFVLFPLVAIGVRVTVAVVIAWFRVTLLY
jgi:hypothetical protein